MAAAVAIAPNAAAAAPGVVSGGPSTFTSYPGLAARVIAHKILPLPVDGSTIAGIQNLFDWSQFGMSMNMPLVAGQFTTAAGQTNELLQTGGVGFVNWGNFFRWVTVSDFDVTWSDGPTPHGQLVAEIDNDPTRRITLFNLDLTGASQTVSGDTVALHHVGLVLTPVGAATLNGALDTSVFLVGETCGTFDTTFSVTAWDRLPW